MFVHNPWLRGLRFNPDNGANGQAASGAGQATSTPPAATPPATPPEAPTQPYTGPTTASYPPSATGQAAPASGQAAAAATQTAAQAAAQAAQQAGILQILREQGLNLPDDERQAASYLMRAFELARQQAQAAAYGQAYAQHQEEFQRYLQERQQAARPTQQQQQAWYSQFWNPPEYNPAWERLVQVDARGNYVPAPGAPFDIVPRYAAYQNYRDQVLQKFVSNPYEFMEQPVRLLAEQVAQQAIQQHLTQYAQAQQAQSIVERHAPMIFQTDANGNRLVDPVYGRPILNDWGNRFKQYAEHAQQLGIYDVAAQEQYAYRLMRADMLEAHMAQAGQAAQGQAGGGQPAPEPPVPQTPHEAANAAYTASARQRQRQPATVPQVTAPPTGRRRMSEMLGNAFRQHGVTDNDAQTTYAGVNGARTR